MRSTSWIDDALPTIDIATRLGRRYFASPGLLNAEIIAAAAASAAAIVEVVVVVVEVADLVQQLDNRDTS